MGDFVSRLITLTTDFGDGSFYVAAMKGSLLSVDPNARIHDLTHQISPQDLKHTAYFLSAATRYFPPKTIHVVVVDPGVGSQRTILYVEIRDQCLLVPDNGCWTSLLGSQDSPARIIQVINNRYWREQVSHTFHGRDIFAPVAGYLSLGVKPADLGNTVTEWVSLALPEPRITESEIIGEVVLIDDFGNLLTNIPGRPYLALADVPVEIRVGKHRVTKRVQTYSQGAVGELVALVSSLETFEVSVNHGSAAELLGVPLGTPVSIRVSE